MSEPPSPWRRQTLLLTALGGAVLLWMPQEGRPFWEILKWDDQTSFPFFLALTLSLFLPVSRSRRYDDLLIWLGNHPKTTSALTFASLALLSPWIYQGKPLSTDEYLLWFQAHSFAKLNLFAQYPPDWLPYLFGSQSLFLSNWREGWLLSPYWPGFSLLLAPFAAVGMPWLCNPAIVGLSAYVLWCIARDLFGSPRACGLTLLLAIASSAFFFNGVTFYAMPAHLLFNAVFTWLLLRPTGRRIYLAGLTGSFALILHNPLPHMLYAAPWIVWLLLSPTQRLRHLLLLALGYLPISLLFGLCWAILRLSIGCSAECAAGTASNAAAASLSAISAFGTSAFVLPGRDIVEWRLAGTAKLWLAAVPSLLVLACLAPVKHHTVPIRLLAASGIITFIGYLFIPFDQGFGWGYRYFHSAWLVLPLLATATALGAQPRPWFSDDDLKRLVRVSVLCLMILFPAKGFVMLRYTTDQWSQLPPHHGSPDEIVFKNAVGNWGLLVAQNPPDLTGAPTIFQSRGQRMDQAFIEKNFPGATLTGTNVFGTTYRVPSEQRPPFRLEERNASPRPQ